MIAFSKLNGGAVKEPKTRLEVLLQLSALLAGYLYIYVYQDILRIEIEFVNFQTLLGIPVIAGVVIPLVKYVLVKPDPLQRSPSRRREIRFFQKEFPSKYILERCQKRCIEDDKSCPNYIKADSYDHVRHWFQDVFHGHIMREDPQRVRDTFEKGYSCKLLYYLTWVLRFALAISLITVVYHHARLAITGAWALQITPFQVFFPIICATSLWLIRAMNVPDENSPSGCWHAWREINRMHVSWLRSQDDLLVTLICHKGTGTRTFKERECARGASSNISTQRS